MKYTDEQLREEIERLRTSRIVRAEFVEEAISNTDPEALKTLAELCVRNENVRAGVLLTKIINTYSGKFETEFRHDAAEYLKNALEDYSEEEGEAARERLITRQEINNGQS